MDDFKVLLQAVLDTKNIGKSDIAKIQKVINKYHLNLVADLDKAAIISEIKEIIPQIEAELKKITGVDIKISDNDLLKAFNQVEKDVARAARAEEKLVDSMEKVRAKTEQARRAEEKRQQIAQAQHQNKALEEEYALRQKIASKAREIQQSIDNGDFETQILAYKTSLEKLGLSTNDISAKMKGVNTAYDELKASAKGENIIPDKVVTNAATLNNEMSRLANVTRQVKLKDSLNADQLQVDQSVVRLNEQLRKNSKYSKDAKEQIRAWINELSKGNVSASRLREINSEAKQLHANMASLGKIGFSGWDKFKQGVNSFKTWISATSVVMATIRAFKSGIDTSKELNKALTNINYTMDVSSSKLKDIGENSLNTAKNLKASAKDVLDAVTTYANANETAETILSKSNPTIMLSNVTGMDTATTTDILQGTIHQFDLEDTEEELYHVSDVLQAVSKSMAVDFSKGIKEMAEGIQVSGSVAKDAGYDIESYSSILGNLIEKTRQSGSELGRSLRTMFVRTTKASTSALAGGEVTEDDLSNAEAALRRVGIKVRDTKDSFRDFDDIMTDLYYKIDTLSEVDLSNIAYEVASTRQTAVFKVMVKTWGDYLNLSERAYAASGETLANQEKYAESLEGKYKGLGSTVESIYANLFQSEDIGNVIDKLQSFANIIDTITDKLGLLGSIGLGGGIFGLIKGIKNLDCRKVLKIAWIFELV